MSDLNPNKKTTELNIQNAEGTEPTTLKIEGLSKELHSSPEKIHALLDLLEMPKGTKVTVTYSASSVIVR